MVFGLKGKQNDKILLNHSLIINTVKNKEINTSSFLENSSNNIELFISEVAKISV